MSPSLLASLPSPSTGTLHIGPLHVQAYGICIALGVYAAASLATRRWRQRGGDPAIITSIAIWAVPAGIVGARIYHVITDNQLYRHHPLNALKIWQGGLGIWGGVAGGVLVGLWVGRRKGADPLALLDTAAPALPLAQAIGRWGNWFNQELFGRPTRLPWALRIDLQNRPAAYARFTTFHPTFLYEFLWDLVVVAIVLAVERRWRLRPGRLFAVYVATYTFGRFFVESLRIDSAHRFFGLRLNDWTSIIVFLAAAAFLVRARASDAEGPAAVGRGSDPDSDAGIDTDIDTDSRARPDAATDPTPDGEPTEVSNDAVIQAGPPPAES